MTKIILVRHGQTEWNRVERFRGRADVPLNEIGLAQAEATARAVATRCTAEAVYSSPLSRAMRTAAAIARRLSVEVETDSSLVDIDYGAWQGLSPDDVRSRWPGLLSAWYRSPHTVRIPGGGSLDEVRTRCTEALRRAVERHVDGCAVLVSHTVVNRVLILSVLGLGNDSFWHLRQDTCAINEIHWEGGAFVLASMNDTCHLLEASATNAGTAIIDPRKRSSDEGPPLTRRSPHVNR